jgi:hypothetical protein
MPEPTADLFVHMAFQNSIFYIMHFDLGVVAALQPIYTRSRYAIG